LFTAKSDTEYGPLTGVIVLQTDADNASDQNSYLDSAYIDIAGFRAGLFYSWWDDGLSGETDSLASNSTLHNSLRYQYESGDFYAGVSVDELEDAIHSRSTKIQQRWYRCWYRWQGWRIQLPADRRLRHGHRRRRYPRYGHCCNRSWHSSASQLLGHLARTLTSKSLSGLLLLNTQFRQLTSSRSRLLFSTSTTS
jgi:hypothetical protein